MEIIKRNGKQETYDAKKIALAIEKAFGSVGSTSRPEIISPIVNAVELKIAELQQLGHPISVETIQDLVEQTLMALHYYAEVRSYILYRDNRAKKREERSRLAAYFADTDLESVLRSLQRTYPEEPYRIEHLWTKFVSFYKEGMNDSEKTTMLIKAAVELTTQEAPLWEYLSGVLLMWQFQRRLTRKLQALSITTFYEKVVYLTENGLYGTYILANYTQAEIEAAAQSIHPENDRLFTYSALDLLLKRYVIRSKDLEPLETPQEMFLGIALHLAIPEKDRLPWIGKFYAMLSSLKVTMATPTLSNSRKPFNQLSSCFIDTVPDSLDGIYRSINNFAQVSKFGGGMGLYFGKVRASGSTIRGFKGAAGGVIRWIKLANDTAVAVDQLGVRQGAVAVYLDVWHKDIGEFLQLRTNNGDDRRKAHDVFPAVCYPDLFWKTVRDDIDAEWHLFCPHEIKTIKGYSLEDYYGEDWEAKYRDCVADERISRRVIPIKELLRLIIKSSVETGTPFTFNRDHVNRMNPNHHHGVIYCSNLCTEIAQNMSAIQSVSQEIKTIDGDTVVVETTRPGDFVVCNLASLSLGNIDVSDGGELRDIVKTTIRALDNVIDLNYYPLPYAKITNTLMRPVGLGVSGYHHMLAKHKIAWESEQHLTFADTIFETINRAAIEASTELALEKGKYAFFEGSDWDTGAYFDKRNYLSTEWRALRERVHQNGMRNGYLMAIAPTSTTSIIAGTTAGLDPIMKKYFLEEKKNGLVPRVAPDLTPETVWFYKNAHTINQEWTIRAAGARTRHIDQAQSLNLYVTNDYTFRQILNLFLLAWQEGVKTLYYVRSKALEVEECESCSS